MLRTVINGSRKLKHNVVARFYKHISLTNRAQIKAFGSSSNGSPDVPASADVVIIGGGVTGCALQYQLTKLGVTNTVLIEKDKLTAGTTWHTAGLVWSLRPNDVEIQFIEMSKRMMKEVDEETGVHTGWINNGGMFIATTKERLDEYKRLHTIGKAWGVESHVLGPDEAKKIYPLLNVNDVYGVLYSPSDGTIEPAGYCNALTRYSTKRGAKVIEGCSVEDIEVKDDDFSRKCVRSVQTSHGTIKTPVVVNCAGAWAVPLGDMAGVKVPLIGMRHAYVVTERIEGIQNMPNVRDHDHSVYLKLQGDHLHVGGYEPNPVLLDQGVAQDFAFSLYELDWDVFSTNINGAINRVPAVETSGIRSTVCGPESFTADHKPLLGESPEVKGYFLNCGYNSAGLMSSGLSCQVAKWIIDGRPEWDMFAYDIRRFHTDLTGNKTWVRERSHESYAKNYSIVFPHDEPLACRNMKTDALHEELLKAGCVYQERQGWERPGWFADEEQAPLLQYDYYGAYDAPKHDGYTYYDKLKSDYVFDFPLHHNVLERECQACRNNVAVFNMSYFGKYYMVGPDAQRAADWIFTNNMQKPPGSTIYTCMTNDKGGTEADLTVSVLESGNGEPHQPSFQGVGFYLALGGGSSEHSSLYIKDIIHSKQFNCKLINHSEDMCLISVQGPKSGELLQSLSSDDFSLAGFPFSTHKLVTVAGHSVRALRLSFVGELGWELHVPNDSAVSLYRDIMKAGQMFGIANAGYRAIDALSIEKGYRHWHADLRTDDTPLESSLGFTCKLNTPTAFRGREALEKQKQDGLRKRLVCLTIDEHIPLHGLETIWRDDKPAGFTRRGDYAFTLGKSIAYGYIKHPDGDRVTNDFIKSGTYHIENLGNKYPATVYIKSPFDPKNQRIQGVYPTETEMCESQKRFAQ